MVSGNRADAKPGMWSMLFPGLHERPGHRRRGGTLVVVGLLWPWVRKLHLFHLPGDIVIDRAGSRLFLPITTMVILSVALSVLAWLVRR